MAWTQSANSTLPAADPSKKERKALAKRYFRGCYHHELSDIVKAHSKGSDTCISAD